VSHRPLAIVSGLTIGDYLLWNWSLNANHDVLSLISGLTLPPLVIAFLWLFARTVARLIARSTRPLIKRSHESADASADRRRSAAAPPATPAALEPSPSLPSSGAAASGSSRTRSPAPNARASAWLGSSS
jgi:hypothetical protein